jgi:hypothetical protein
MPVDLAVFHYVSDELFRKSCAVLHPAFNLTEINLYTSSIYTSPALVLLIFIHTASSFSSRLDRTTGYMFLVEMADGTSELTNEPTDNQTTKTTDR